MSEILRKKILVVEDEPIMRLALKDALVEEGCEVDTAEDGHEGIELFRSKRHDIVLTDLVMPGLHGLELIERIMELDPATDVFAFTAYGNVDTAVKAMKLGALDFLTKPFMISDLVERIRRAQLRHESPVEMRARLEEVDDRYRFDRLLGKSPKMQEVYDLIEIVATSDANILVQGESGTGKELVAAAIHFNSPRRDFPFVKVSCASLTETLLESELFGYEKGAFTGALGRKIGRFEQADGGTLFLDEIGDLSETVQIKLLRILQERAFERVGGTETIRVDVRIVSATLHDIEGLVERGRFREDLFYRINTVAVKLPTLAERGGADIRLLADHFCKLHGQRIGKEVDGFTDSAYEQLERYSWPGNVRELKNSVERAVLLSQGRLIDVNDLPESLRRLEPHSEPEAIRERLLSPPSTLELELRKTEEKHIRRVLDYTSFNRTKAAKLLGISRKTLWGKMRQFDIRERDQHGK